ncbi:hypothetical protein DAMA08_017240 [Martiniozyma asiatica (nom. inval.)]|nr:hypothetical protein DAMA08_017240 [Martiniozyma asiatica]
MAEYTHSKEQLAAYLQKTKAKRSAKSVNTASKVKSGHNSSFAKFKEDGKRAIGYEIMKNKGLTAHRKKENRNARVKKRNKYDKAKKKLKSQRAVYEGQKGKYIGEESGIRRNLSRSVKLS